MTKNGPKLSNSDLLRERRCDIERQFRQLWDKIVEQRGTKLSDEDKQIKRLLGDLQSDLADYFDGAEKLIG